MIVFGWNHFRLKSFSAQELGLSQGHDQRYTIELRQKYFHLFWIPFFGIGKKWTIRKDNKLYEMPAEHAAYLDSQNYKLRTPWYTFSGPILLVSIFLFWNISEQVDAARYRREAKNNFEKQIKGLDRLYLAAASSDYYKLQPQKGTDKYVLLQVQEVKPKEIVFKKIVTGLSDYELTARKIESLFSRSTSFDTIVVSKAMLDKAVERQFDKQYVGTDLFDDGTEYIVKDIYKLNGPMLVDRGTGGYYSGRLNLELMNYGWPASLLRIENKYGKLNWEMEFPTAVGSAENEYDPNGKLVLAANNYEMNTPYEFELVMRDSLAREHRYNVKGNYMDKTITQLY